MSSVSARACERSHGAPSAAPRRGERYFWSGLALALAAVVFAGFAPSYFLKAQLHMGPELTPLLHVHGAIMTTWLVLLVTQTSLIAAGRVEWHRRLGVGGVILAGGITVLMAFTAIVRAKAGFLGPPGGPPPLGFLSIPLVSVIVFPALFGAAIVNRRRSDYHKRLVILATLELVTAAIARLPGLDAFGPPGFFLGADLFIVAIAIRDFATLRRLHPATLWGGLFLVLSQPLRLIISTTPAWLAFARWVTS